MTATWITGNTLDVLRAMPDDTVDLVVTSPPFLLLRSYLADDDPDKGNEIGAEPTPGAFIDGLLDITEELRRVLGPFGSMCIELGDTYTTAGGGTEWPVDKSLTMVPELYRLALAYGSNPLTGRTTPRWRVRNVIRWVRPNPPVGALGDKFRPGTSDMVVATGTDEPGRNRYFDMDAVRAPNGRAAESGGARSSINRHNPGFHTGDDDTPMRQNPFGAPPLDWWEIPVTPYKGSHYATFPPGLVSRPVKAMCPLRVCRTCGEPSRRIVEHERTVDVDATPSGKSAGALHSGGPMTSSFAVTRHETVGWTDCGHGTWRPGIVLDPFAGTGTTVAVATGHGRDAIGIDLDARNAELACERIGPLFFTLGTVSELWPVRPPQLFDGAR